MMFGLGAWVAEGTARVRLEGDRRSAAPRAIIRQHARMRTAEGDIADLRLDIDARLFQCGKLLTQSDQQRESGEGRGIVGTHLPHPILVAAPAFLV